MTRLHDWPQRLDRYVAGLCDVPFAWGSADCCQFIAGAIHAVTGEDLRALFPAYADETDAQALARMDTKGYEAAQAALELANLSDALDDQ